MRFLFYFILVPFLFWLVRSVLHGAFDKPTNNTARDPFLGMKRPPPPVSSGGELKKDPICGTYISTATAVAYRAGGKVTYFCSTECRDKYTYRPQS